MNIAVLTAFHGRPYVSVLYVRYLRAASNALKQRGIFLHSFAACTTGDMQPVIPDVICRNEPVSEKHNRLGEFICTYGDWYRFKNTDYVLQLGSDDIIHQDLFELYRPAIGAPVIGLKDMVFYSVSDRRTKIIHRTQMGNCFGAGRMIRYDVFRHYGGRLWPADRNSGLDWYSFEKIGLREAQFSQREKPVCVDLKTSENIWKFDSLNGTEIEKPEWVEI